MSAEDRVKTAAFQLVTAAVNYAMNSQPRTVLKLFLEGNDREFTGEYVDHTTEYLMVKHKMGIKKTGADFDDDDDDSLEYVTTVAFYNMDRIMRAVIVPQRSST